ncbi:MAG: ATP-binding protein [Anaerolineales bacterium]
MSSENVAVTHSSQKLKRILELSRNIASMEDLPAMLNKITIVACELTDSNEASILLYDRTSSDLRFQAVANNKRLRLLKTSVPLDASVAGHVFTTAMPLVIQDAEDDPRVFREIDRRLAFQTHSIMAVPLVVEQVTVGVLEAINKKDESNYTEDDLAILEIIGAHTALAIRIADLGRKLQESNANLRNLDRMKSDFIAIASHELRTPLGLVEEVAGRFREVAAAKKIHLSYDVPDGDTLTIDGEREKIDVALSNIVQNAVIFTDPNGQVGIKAERAGDKVKVFIVDTGIGIPAADIERIFDRFYQVESHLTRKHGGMGLGLSIARAMVELHDGEIWCESREGTGSLFCFALPIKSSRDLTAASVFMAE